MNVVLKEKEFKRLGNMTINREDKSKGNYTKISNNLIQDSRLSLKEKGLMLHILSKPDDWYLNVDEISNNNNDGKKGVYSAIKKLKDFGYIFLAPVHNEKKQIISWRYTINEATSLTIVNTEPEPLTQKVHVEKVHVGNRHYTNTDLTKTNNTKTPISPLPKTEVKKVVLNNEQKELEKQLIDLGINTAKNLIRDFDNQEIKLQLSYYPFREKHERTAGCLVNFIKVKQPAPLSFTQNEALIKRKEFNQKWKTILSIWRVQQGNTIDNTKVNLSKAVIEKIVNLKYYQATGPDYRFNEDYLNYLEEFKIKCTQSLKSDINFQEFTDLIKNTCSEKKDITMIRFMKENSHVTPNVIDKFISHAISEGV